MSSKSTAKKEESGVGSDEGSDVDLELSNGGSSGDGSDSSSSYSRKRACLLVV